MAWIQVRWVGWLFDHEFMMETNKLSKCYPASQSVVQKMMQTASHSLEVMLFSSDCQGFRSLFCIDTWHKHGRLFMFFLAVCSEFGVRKDLANKNINNKLLWWFSSGMDRHLFNEKIERLAIWHGALECWVCECWTSHFFSARKRVFKESHVVTAFAATSVCLMKLQFCNTHEYESDHTYQ